MMRELTAIRSMAELSCVTDLSGEPRPRELRASQHMRDNPRGGLCSRCGQPVQVGPDAVACVCSACVAMLAELERAGYWSTTVAQARVCPDCGQRPVKARKRVCAVCAVNRKRTTDREIKNRARARRQLSHFGAS